MVETCAHGLSATPHGASPSGENNRRIHFISRYGGRANPLARNKKIGRGSVGGEWDAREGGRIIGAKERPVLGADGKVKLKGRNKLAKTVREACCASGWVARTNGRCDTKQCHMLLQRRLSEACAQIGGGKAGVVLGRGMGLGGLVRLPS
jgi:hypothetical protein